MRVRFMCSDGTWLYLSNVNMTKLEQQCWSRAKREGKLPTRPLVYEVVSEHGNVVPPTKPKKETHKEEWIQLQFKL